jgi:hypothetical protein
MSLSISTDEPTVDCLLMAGSLPQDVLGMAATVTSYDQVFGPDHPQTLPFGYHGSYLRIDVTGGEPNTSPCQKPFCGSSSAAAD